MLNNRQRNNDAVGNRVDASRTGSQYQYPHKVLSVPAVDSPVRGLEIARENPSPEL